MKFSKLSNSVIGFCIEVHKELGPGLLESTYEHCLAYELVSNGYKVERQKALPVFYKDVKIDCGYRIDLLVEEQLILELKCVESISPIYEAQILTYLKLSKIKHGLLINFNTKRVRDGIRSFVL